MPDLPWEEDRAIASTALSDLTDTILRFRDARNWRQFHNPKDMAVSLSLEVAELLELMQWKNGAELEAHLAQRRHEVGEELSDILYWTLLIAHDLGIDLADAFRAKMAVNEAKYPVEHARNSSRKYDELMAAPSSQEESMPVPEGKSPHTEERSMS